MLKAMNRFFEKSYFPLALKYFSLAAFVVLIITGLSANSSDSVFLKELRNTNFGNLVVWSFWWPAIIIVAIFFGRFWCMVCPVEVITTFFAKIGLKRKRPKWLLSGWAITVFYVLILFFGMQGFAIHYLAYFPNFIIQKLEINNILIAGFIKSTILFFIVPVILWMIPFWISKISGAGIKVKHYFINYAIAFIPVMAAAHIGKSLIKSITRIPYLRYIFNDFSGNSTAQKIIDGEIVLAKVPDWINMIV